MPRGKPPNTSAPRSALSDAQNDRPDELADLGPSWCQVVIRRSANQSDDHVPGAQIVAEQGLVAAGVDVAGAEDEPGLLRALVRELVVRALRADPDARLLDLGVGSHRRGDLLDRGAPIGGELLVLANLD